MTARRQRGPLIVCYYQLASQAWWSGRRWVADPSDAQEYESDAHARSALRERAARGQLTERDRAVVVADYGYVTEKVIYHVEGDGVVAGPLRDMVQP